MKAEARDVRRYFFTPSADGTAWEMTEARRTPEGWEVRQAGVLGMRVLPNVPPPGADWLEARPPSRPPRLPKPEKAKSEGAKAEPAAKVVPKPKARPAKPALAAKPKRAAPAVDAAQLPDLSRELEGLMLDEQKRAKAPEGMVKCPLCGLVIQPTRTKKVRTHDNPVKGSRCEASNRPWAEFA